MRRWYDTVGANGEIVISSRIRLARNLTQYNFMDRMDAEEKEKLSRAVEEKLQGMNLGANSLDFYRLEQMTETEKQSLVEQHLASPDFIQKDNTMLALSDDRRISIMVNEEDHLRIQVITSGFDLDEAFRLANQCDDFLNEAFEYAFDESLGYLTTCMTNLGTGLRASVMLHLPALEAAGALGSIINTVSKLGLTIRGTFGEGTNAYGAIYQLSNQITLGISEEQAIDNLKNVVNQILYSESEARKSMLEHNRLALEDAIFRSYGILQYARTIQADELYRLLSDIRLGVSLGLLPNVTLETLNYLLASSGDATLKAASGSDLAVSCGQKRAETVQKCLVSKKE